jgi:hypothetical protein
MPPSLDCTLGQVFIVGNALDLLITTAAAMKEGTEMVSQVAWCLQTANLRMQEYGRYVVSISTPAAWSIVALTFKNHSHAFSACGLGHSHAGRCLSVAPMHCHDYVLHCFFMAHEGMAC